MGICVKYTLPMKVERPKLISRLTALYWMAYESPGKAVDEAIKMIRDEGIENELETRSLLAASDYGLEKAGTVTALVMSV